MNAPGRLVVMSDDDVARLLCDVVRREVRAVFEAALPVSPESTPSDEAAKLPELATAQEVGALVRFTPRTLRRLVHLGRFPPPIRLGERALRWRREDVLGWLANPENRK